MVILSLDIANSCGYAVFKDDKIIDYGVWNLCRHKRGKEPTTHIELYEQLERITKRHKITHLVIEDAYIPANNKESNYKSLNAPKSLLKKHGVVALFCECYNMSCDIITPMRAKRFMFKANKSMGRDLLKVAMINEVRKLGYTLPQQHTDDVADAIGILCTHLNRKIRA